VISYDSSRGGVSVVIEKGESTTTHLLIQRATAADSGVYRYKRRTNSISYPK
jgi:neurotrimin